ncbi:unnamed protein product, partial [Musa acuminata subsp. malaccensis]
QEHREINRPWHTRQQVTAEPKKKQERPTNDGERYSRGRKARRGTWQQSPVASLNAALDSRESSASRIGRTQLSGMPPARPNLAAIEPFD